jgi:hypothetical protein
LDKNYGGGYSVPTLQTNRNLSPYGGAYGPPTKGWRGFGQTKGGAHAGFKGSIRPPSNWGVKY